MTDELNDNLRDFTIQRMVNGVVRNLVVRAENLSAAKRMADEMAGGNAKDGAR